MDDLKELNEVAFATLNDIADRLGCELDEAEARIVTVRLEDAERIIESKIPDLMTLVLDGTVSAAAVTMVESEAVLRVIRNPDGYRTDTDGNYSYEIDQRVATGRLVILDEEWALLGVRDNIFTIKPKVYVPGTCFGDYWWHGWMDPDDTASWA